jgi:hypothetical protein
MPAFLILTNWPCWASFRAVENPDQSADSQSRLAARIIANFMAGVVDEAELITLSRLPLGR